MDNEQKTLNTWRFPQLGEAEKGVLIDDPDRPSGIAQREAELEVLIAQNKALQSELSEKTSILNACLQSLGDNLKDVTETYVDKFATLIGAAVKKIVGVEISNNAENYKQLLMNYLNEYGPESITSVTVSPKIKELISDSATNIHVNQSFNDADLQIELSDKIISVDINSSVDEWIKSYGK